MSIHDVMKAIDRTFLTQYRSGARRMYKAALELEKENAELKADKDRLIAELRYLIDPMIEAFIHKASLGNECGCVDCVRERVELILDKEFLNASEEPI